MARHERAVLARVRYAECMRTRTPVSAELAAMCYQAPTNHRTFHALMREGLIAFNSSAGGSSLTDQGRAALDQELATPAVPQ